MSILIKGLEMPKDCPVCPCAHWNKNDIMTGCEIVWRYVPDSETAYWQSDKRPDWCPLVEVPTPHGRLIDADWIREALIDTLEALKKNPKMDRQEMHLIAAFSTLGRMLEDAPTIIEAEEGSHE